MALPSKRNDGTWLYDPELLEALAAVEHERWSHWQRYLHSRCQQRPDGTLVIPAELARRWTEQMTTPYEALSEREQESDREQAHEYLAVIRDYLGG